MKKLFVVVLTMILLAGLASLTLAEQETPKIPTTQKAQGMMPGQMGMMPMQQMMQACLQMMQQMAPPVQPPSKEEKK